MPQNQIITLNGKNDLLSYRTAKACQFRPKRVKSKSKPARSPTANTHGTSPLYKAREAKRRSSIRPHQPLAAVSSPSSIEVIPRSLESRFSVEEIFTTTLTVRYLRATNTGKVARKEETEVPLIFHEFKKARETQSLRYVPRFFEIWPKK